MRHATMVAWALMLVVAGVPGCKKRSEDRGGSGTSAAAPAETPGAGARADRQPDQPAPGGGAAIDRTVESGGAQGGGMAQAAPVAPAGAPAGPQPAGETPRTLPCPPNRRAWEPTSPDPEAGDFTLEEALAGLPGTGQPVATIETSLGTVTCRLAGDLVPVAVANFVGLARGLRPWWDPCRAAWVKEPFYDGLTWHRVIPGFMAQGGDLFGDGSGGPGYTFANEQRPELLHDRPGTLAYANAGRDTNGSQFYITVGRRPQLDGGYVVFGYCDNVQVIEQIVAVPRDVNDKPLQPVLIRKVTITREG